MTASYCIKGTVTDITTCDCCGRKGLRRTVALMPLDVDGNEVGEVSYYGTGCAAALLGWTNGRVTTSAKNADMKAEVDRYYAIERARRIIRTFGPVENADIRTRATAWRESGLRSDQPFTSVTDDIRNMLADARALLSV